MPDGCEFCIDAPEVDFDWCRVCGRGLPEEPPKVEPMTGLRYAVRKAKGGPLTTDGPEEIAAFYAAVKTEREAPDAVD